MSQNNNFNWLKNEGKKENLLDEDILLDEDMNFGSQEDEIFFPNKKISKDKNIKSKNLQNYRDKRLISKINKENIFMNEDQLNYAKKVVENMHKNEINNNKINFSNLKTENSISNFTIIGNKPTNININNEIPISSAEEKLIEILTYIGLINGCSYKILLNNTDYFQIEIIIQKDERSFNQFELLFKKKEDTEFVDYTPINSTFIFEQKDEVLKEPLEIHKDDLGMLMKKFLNYKFNN